MIVDERRGSLARPGQTGNRFDPHLHTMPDLRRLSRRLAARTSPRGPGGVTTSISSPVRPQETSRPSIAEAGHCKTRNTNW
jgi:hypothetical protein